MGSLMARPFPLTHAILSRACVGSALGFVVSRDDPGTGAPREDWLAPGMAVYLYDCDDFHSDGPQ